MCVGDAPESFFSFFFFFFFFSVRLTFLRMTDKVGGARGVEGCGECT